MRDFTQGSVPRHLVAFSIPLLCSNLVQALFQAIDALWVGRLIGPEALAAVSTTFPIFFLVLSVLIGLGVATGVLFGQAYGARNLPRLTQVLSTSLALNLLLAVLVAVFGLVFADAILGLINTPANIRADAAMFLRIILAGLPFTVLVPWIAGIFNGIGDSRTPLLILLATLGLNAVLAPILIRGILFIPALGIAGSALSTVLANTLACGIAFVVFRRHAFLSSLGLSLRVDRSLARTMLAIGLPMSLQIVIVSFSFLLVMALANLYGEDITAVLGIGGRIDQFAMMSIMAVMMAVSAMTAQNLGAGKPERVREIVKWALALAFGLAAFFFVAVSLFPAGIGALFTDDPQIRREIVGYFHLVRWSYFGLALLFTLQGVVRGAGDTLCSLAIVASSMILFRMPLCYGLAECTPLRQHGLWLGITISSFVGGLLFAAYYRSGRWKNRSIAPAPSATE